MTELNSLSGCCGLRELNNLSHYGVDTEGNPRMTLRDFYKTTYGVTKERPWQEKKFRYIIFTEASRLYRQQHSWYGYGTKFAAYLLENKLGEVVIASEGEHINPNSLRKLKMWVWTIDHDAVEAFGKKEFPEIITNKEMLPKPPPPKPLPTVGENSRTLDDIILQDLFTRAAKGAAQYRDAAANIEIPKSFWANPDGPNEGKL